jgi:hypothetical protein
VVAGQAILEPEEATRKAPSPRRTPAECKSLPRGKHRPARQGNSKCDFPNSASLARLPLIQVQRVTIRLPQRVGAVAQLGERLNGIQEVRGSIPLGSTSDINRLAG